MDESIRDYYEETKLEEDTDEVPAEEYPLAWTQIFYKNYPRFDQTELEPRQVDGEVTEVLRNRKSTKEYERRPLEFETLSTVMHEGLHITDEEERRPYPSGGARYPVETYLLSFDVEGLEGGAYHYNVQDDALELLVEDDLEDRRENFLSPFIDWAPASLMFTSVLSRSEVKYGANAYRFSLLEAGHMAQNLSLLSIREGLGCCPVGGFVNDTVDETLDLPEEEIPIYSLVVGHPAEENNSTDEV